MPPHRNSLKRHRSYRIPDMTFHQIEDLARWWGIAQTEVIIRLADRAWMMESSGHPAGGGADTPPMTGRPGSGD